MFVLLASFLLGITSGLRALAGLVVLSWAARLGYVPLEHTWLASSAMSSHLTSLPPWRLANW